MEVFIKNLITTRIFLFACSLNWFSQVINTQYFPADREIDKQYEVGKKNGQLIMNGRKQM